MEYLGPTLVKHAARDIHKKSRTLNESGFRICGKIGLCCFLQRGNMQLP